MSDARDSAANDPSSEWPAGALGEQAWLDVIRRMDEVYRELLDYEAALEQQNEALAESQRFIFSVLTSMSDVLVVCNRAGVIEDLNPSLLELTGCTEAELRGTSLFDLFADDQSRRVMEEHLATRAGERLSDCELQMRGAGGVAVPVTLSCTPRFTGTGRPVGMVVTGRPVGELRRAYSALRQAHEDLKRTQQQLLQAEKMASLGRLVAGVAHELNNPISFVLGNVAALKKYASRLQAYLAAVHREPLSEELQALRNQLRIDALLADLPSLMDGMQEGGERTRDIVDGLKRFSALGTDALAPLDLRSVLERAVAWVTKAAPDQLRITVQAPDPLPVKGNAGRLLQVFMNLVQNAVDATAGREGGHVTIRARCEAGQVCVAVADNGLGIAPENLPKVFDPFFTTKPVGRGVGLGLSISYGIVEQHGGRLTAENAPEGGAVFLVQLPAHSEA
jgi:two-component system sensor histidine kinase HupT/HoxJ